MKYLSAGLTLLLVLAGSPPIYGSTDFTSPLRREAISMDVPAAPAAGTRAAVSGFVEGDKLGILAYQLNADGAWNTSVKPDFMYNIPLTKVAGRFDYPPPREFYPGDGSKIKFFAYYPYSDSAGASGITLSGPDASDYPTLMFRADGTQDLLAAVTEAQDSGVVSLRCKHILGKINLSMKTDLQYAIVDEVVITSVRIAGVKNEGRFSFGSYTTQSTDKMSWWSVSGTAASPDFYFTTECSVNYLTPAYLLAEPLLLIPQTSRLAITVTARARVGQVTTELSPQTFTIDAASWGAGDSRNYIMTLKFDEALLESVTFSASGSAAGIGSGQKIGVLGYLLDVVGSWNPLATPDFMYNVPLTKNYGGFDYAPVQKYPADSRKLKFFAYYPYSDPNITLSGASAAGYPTLSFRTGDTASGGDGKVDLMAGASAAQNTGTVDLPMQSILGKLNVKIDLSGNVDLYAKKIVIEGIVPAGIFSFANYVNDPGNGAVWWSTTGSSSTLTFEFPDVLLPQGTLTTIWSGWFVPQTASIKVTVYHTDGTSGGGDFQELSLSAGGSVDYTYKLMVGEVIDPDTDLG